MAYRDLNVGPTFEQDQRRKETVHPVKEREPAGHLRADYLQRAARILRAVVGKQAPPAIGKTALKTLPSAVLAPGADARGHIMAVQGSEQQVEIFGGCLEVGVEVADQL